MTTDTLSNDPMLSEDATARYLNTSPRTLQRWRQAGTGPKFTKLGHLVRYRKSWLDAHIEAQARTSTSAAA
jgi:hypothetical protein